MATLPNTETAGFPDVYQLEETDPVTGGPDGIDNLPHKQLAERDQHLLARVEPLEKQADDSDYRLTMLENSGSAAVGRAFPLWLSESESGGEFELFTEEPAYTWRDYDPQAVVGTVTGDESIDVTTTNNLTVGDSYVIVDPDGTFEIVTIQAILNATRIRAVDPLTKTRTDSGRLSHTSWDIRAGYAMAGTGVYLSRQISALRFETSGVGRLIIRREAGAGEIAVSARLGAQSDGTMPTERMVWTRAPLVTSTQRDAAVDLEYEIPMSGLIELRIETSVTDGDELIRIEHMLCLPSLRAGRADPVRQPVNLAPAAGANSVIGIPTLTASEYFSLYGTAHASTHIEIASDSEFGVKVLSERIDAATEFSVPQDTLDADRAYFWRIRYEDVEGTRSPWSEPTGFSTGDVFEYIAPPRIVSPAENASSVSLRPTLITTEFDAVGADDTHISSQYRITDSDGVMAYDSGDTDDLTSHRITVELSRDSAYRLQARHKGQTIGWSEWSATRAFRTSNAADTPAITAPADGESGVAFESGIVINASSFSFPGGGEGHVASDWQLRDTDSGEIVAEVDNSGAFLTSWTPPAAALIGSTTYDVRVRYKGATTGFSSWSPWSSFTTAEAVGEIVFTQIGTHYWEVPAGVSTICGVAVGGGASGGEDYSGGGGGLQYINDWPVTPGDRIPVTVGGAGTSSSIGDIITAFGGSGTSAGGGVGGRGGSGRSGADGHGKGGGGAGGYPGYSSPSSGGPQLTNYRNGGDGGDGVGLYGGNAAGDKAGSSGGFGGSSHSGSRQGSGGHGGRYGGGGGAMAEQIEVKNARPGLGGAGGVRIIWGGSRSYPDNAI